MFRSNAKVLLKKKTLLAWGQAQKLRDLVLDKIQLLKTVSIRDMVSRRSLAFLPQQAPQKEPFLPQQRHLAPRSL